MNELRFLLALPCVPQTLAVGQSQRDQRADRWPPLLFTEHLPRSVFGQTPCHRSQCWPRCRQRPDFARHGELEREIQPISRILICDIGWNAGLSARKVSPEKERLGVPQSRMWCGTTLNRRSGPMVNRADQPGQGMRVHSSLGYCPWQLRRPVPRHGGHAREPVRGSGASTDRHPCRHFGRWRSSCGAGQFPHLQRRPSRGGDPDRCHPCVLAERAVFVTVLSRSGTT